jgi:hypothetical protein
MGTTPTPTVPGINAAGIKAIRTALYRAEQDLEQARRAHYEASEKEHEAAAWVAEVQRAVTDLKEAIAAVSPSADEATWDLHIVSWGGWDEPTAAAHEAPFFRGGTISTDASPEPVE